MNQSEKSQFLGTEKIGKLMLKFSIPCVLSLLVSALYNIVDQIFIGNSELSALGNAATGVVFPIFIIAQAFAWCFGDGCAAYLNICQGKKDTQSAHRAIGTGIIVTLVASIVLMAVFFPLKTQLLTLFGASENSIGMAIEYFNIILAFFPVYMLSNMMNAVVRADGSPAWSMASMAVGAIINIILDPTFIFGLHWGMRGRRPRYGDRSAGFLCDKLRLFLPHQDLPAYQEKLCSRFQSLFRRSEAGSFFLHYTDDYCYYLAGVQHHAGKIRRNVPLWRGYPYCDHRDRKQSVYRGHQSGGRDRSRLSADHRL